MFRRRTKTKPSFLLHTTNRGSDITKPDNTSLLVNQSKKSDEQTDELPKALSCLSSESEEDDECDNRQSTSVMRSMSQKQQSTPVNSQLRILSGKNENQSKLSSSLILSNKTPAKNLQKENIQFERRSQQKSSYYEEVVRSCGAVQLPGNASYLLSEDQAVFTVKVNKMIKENVTNKDKFLKSLEEHVKDDDNLKKMLAHTQTADDCEIARGPVQEPIMRLLLQADSIQIGLLELLLNKIADLVLDSDDPDNVEIGVISSILRQLRFLNRIKESTIAGKLFEIIDAAPVNVQREIIFMLPEILTQEEIEAEKVSEKLVDLMKFNSMLTHVIIDALTNLPLSYELRSQVREKIITRLEKCPAEFLPLLVQFAVTRCDPNYLLQVVSALRENLPFTLQHHELRVAEKESSKKKNDKKLIDENSYFKLTFENLKFSVMSSKQMTDVWIKIITNTKAPNDVKCIDLIMLVIIYSNVSGRKNQISALLRNKIKTGILEEIHVRHMFKILLVVAMEYSSAILELSSICLKSYEPAVADFGVILYETAFNSYNFYLRQNVISDILLHIGTGTPLTINMALTILQHLTEKNLETLTEHTVVIMGLLMKLSDLEPTQVRQLVDIIASLIFSSFTDDALGSQDELQMFIRKQISAFNVEQNRKGVVAAVMYAKHAVANASGVNFEEKLTEANSLLELAMGSRAACEAKAAFFNDELATMIRENEPNGRFIKIWNERAYKEAKENLFARNIDLECEYFPMSLQYGLDGPDDKKFVFPILDVVIKMNTNKTLNIPVPVIPSLLRLLWCSEQDFSRIEPLLSASVIMATPTVFDKFSSYGFLEQKLIMDCLYVCANYFIECINAFSTQKTGEKIIIRIKQLIEVRKLIVKYQSQIPDYIPPLCQFYAPVQKPVTKKRAEPKKGGKKGKKRKSDGTTAEPGPSQAISLAPSQPLDQSELPSTSNSSSVEIIGHTGISREESDLHAYKGYFREMHCAAHKLLRMEMTLNPTVVFKKTKISDILVDEISWSYRPTEKPELGPSDFLFLLDDFIFKCENILKETKRVPWTIKSKQVFSKIESMSTETFIASSVKILPKLCAKLALLSSYCKDLIAANDGVYDALGMYSKDAADIKLAFAACLRAIAEILSWRGFQNPNNRTLLKEALTILSSNTPSQSIATITNLASQAADYICSFSTNNLLLSGGISIVKGIEACFQYGHHRNNVLYSLCYELLCRPWYTVAGQPERGSVFNQHVDILLKTYFSTVDDKLEVVRKTAQIAVDEVEQLTTKDSTMESFKTINKSNFPLLYRSLCETLVSAASEELSKVQDDHEECLKTWSQIIETMQLLVAIVKLQSSRINLCALLKRSQALINLFLSKGMPVMESALRIKFDDVSKIFKNLQCVTRFLHAICCHSKINSDAVVAAHVPGIRSSCERITLEVKGMLILHKIPIDLMTIAVLKNKDIQGNDVLSQTTNDDSEDESELPPEETGSEDQETELDNDEENSRDGTTSTHESNSEIY